MGHPLKNKKDKYEGSNIFYWEKDVKLAVEWLKEKIRVLPNRDDKIKSTIKFTDGGGVGKFEVLDYIDKAFEDVIEEECDEKYHPNNVVKRIPTKE